MSQYGTAIYGTSTYTSLTAVSTKPRQPRRFNPKASSGQEKEAVDNRDWPQYGPYPEPPDPEP